jgi:predicted nucleic acid-binding protein
MLFLADTSIWIDHFRHTNVKLSNFSVGVTFFSIHLSSANWRSDMFSNFEMMINNFRDLPRAPVADTEEVLQLIVRNKLFGSGIGYVDAHMLASTLVKPDIRLWTRDKRLHGGRAFVGCIRAED